jgi:Tfp pilus assembly protein PilF
MDFPALGLKAPGQAEEAGPSVRQVQAGAAPQLVRLGVERIKAGDRHNAREMFLGALNADNDCADAYQSLAGIALGPDCYGTAIALARRALALQPHNAMALLNLGNLFWRAQRFAEAESALLEALALAPNHCGVHQNLGLLYYTTNRADQALKAFTRALEIEPESLSCQNDYAHAVLKTGDLARGLDLLELRWKGFLAKNPIWETGLPKWVGEHMESGTLLLHAEQGFGDTLQFCRFIPAIKEHAGRRTKIVFACPEPLHRLMAGQCGIDEVISDSKAGPIVKAAMKADYHCPLMSAVSALKPSYSGDLGVWVKADQIDTVITGRPYLKAPGKSKVMFRAGGARLAIGLCWGASQTPERGTQKSVEIEELVDLASIPGVRLWSLQFGPHADDLARTAADCAIGQVPQGLGDFADTAAVIAGLDIVISVDTAIAHLAGALGKPVFMLNPFHSCWRWVHGAAPWYSTMTIFDQKTPENWTAPLAEIKDCLAAMIAASARGRVA